MNCRTGERLLLLQQDDTLPSVQARELAGHLEACPACRRYQGALTALSTDLYSLSQDAPTRAGMAQQAVAQWADAKTPIAAPAPHAPWFRPAIALTLGVTLLAVGWGTVQNLRTQRLNSELARAQSLFAESGVSSVRLPAKAAESSLPLPTSPLLEKIFVGTGIRVPVTSRSRLRTGLHPVGAPDVHSVGDNQYLNTDPMETLAHWTRTEPDEMAGMMGLLQASVCGGDDFVNVPLPQVAGLDDKKARAAANQYKQEAEIVDERLTKKVTLGEKGISFAELCRLLHEQTGIELKANASVSDDKVTLFCKGRSLRDIMRQVNRLFGYLWNRSGEAGAFHYELTQSVRAQLAEEELCNRDRNEALLALDQAMERYRKFLNLTPEEAKAQAELAGPEDKKILDSLAGSGWGPAHLYFGLSPDDMNALRNGQELHFGEATESGQGQSLPSGVSDGILKSLDKLRAHVGPGGELNIGPADSVPDGQPLSEIPGASALASLHLDTSELGQMALSGNSGASIKSSQPNPGGGMSNNNAVVMTGGPLAVGVSPSVGSPKNADANAKLARDPALRPHTTLAPKASSAYNARATLVTTADLEEALFKATGKDILADYYTRLYEPGQVSMKDKPLFDALNQVCDTIHDRWNWENGFLQFRSTGFFNDRLKEVPNRLLTRWAESRKAHGGMSLEELIEIAQLTDRQLNAETMAQGAMLLYGLNQWEQAQNMRDDWRFLARLTPEQRRTMLTAKGLPYARLPITLQEKFLALLYGPAADQLHLDSNDLTNALLRVEYALPKSSDGGATPPEPKITYQISGGATVSQRTRTVTPHEEEITSPGETQKRQKRTMH